MVESESSPESNGKNNHEKANVESMEVIHWQNIIRDQLIQALYVTVILNKYWIRSADKNVVHTLEYNHIDPSMTFEEMQISNYLLNKMVANVRAKFTRRTNGKRKYLLTHRKIERTMSINDAAKALNPILNNEDRF